MKKLNKEYQGQTHQIILSVGSQDFGNWTADMKKHTFSIKWNNGWIDTTTYAYDVNGNIEFYDIDTGK